LHLHPISTAVAPLLPGGTHPAARRRSRPVATATELAHQMGSNGPQTIQVQITAPVRFSSHKSITILHHIHSNMPSN